MTERNTGAALVFGMGLLFVYYTFVLKQPIFQAPVTQTEVGEVGGWAEPEEGIERGEFGLAEREDVYSYPESTRGELPGSGGSKVAINGGKTIRIIVIPIVLAHLITITY